VIGVGESTAEYMLKDIFDSQANPTIAPYAKDGEVHLRITAKTDAPEESDSLIAEMEQKVRAILGDNIYGCNEETLEEAVLKLLQEKNLTVSLAESCTGGLIASRLTDIPGASASFVSGVVSYSNESKINILKVKEDTIKKYGAVSPQTAEEMAVGAKTLNGSDIGLSITGIAGPDGGSAEKPVGLCYIGIAAVNSVNVHKIMLNGNRNKIRWSSSSRALDLLRRELLSM